MSSTQHVSYANPPSSSSLEQSTNPRTQYVAGQSESFLAEADYKGLGFKLATKVYPSVPGTHAPAMLRSKVHDSLTALNTEDVDIFYLHAADRSVPFVDTLQTVNELYKEGHFKTLGLSNYTAYEVAEIVTLCKERGWVRPKIYQVCDNNGFPGPPRKCEC